MPYLLVYFVLYLDSSASAMKSCGSELVIYMASYVVIVDNCAIAIGLDQLVICFVTLCVSVVIYCCGLYMYVVDIPKLCTDQ